MMKIKKRNFLKKKKIKEMKNELKEYGDLLDGKKNVEILETEFNSFILVDNEPYIILIDDKPYPTIKALLNNEIEGKTVTVDMGAVKFVTNGADIMNPGIVNSNSNILPGDVVTVIDEKNKKPLAVGVSLISGPEMIEDSHGKAIKIQHYVGDEIWNFGV